MQAITGNRSRSVRTGYECGDRMLISPSQTYLPRYLGLKTPFTSAIHRDVWTSEFGSQDPGGHLFHRWLTGVHVFCTCSLGKPGTQRRVPFLQAGDVS